MELTGEQKQAHDQILDWFNAKSRRMYLTLGGLAGCGKTTLCAQIAGQLKADGKRLAFCAPSGKAASVLRAKLGDILTTFDYCGTIHGLIYNLIGKKKERSGRTDLIFAAAEDRVLPYDLIIVDESSMVDEWSFNDLMSYGVPLLCVGDHKQLGPVKDKFNLMARPEIKLETIMRQAEGDPIVRLATLARNGEKIAFGNYGPLCRKTMDVSFFHKHDFNNLDSIILCAKNDTKVTYNSFARRNFAELVPVVGEPVICLANNKPKKIFNGNIGRLVSLFDQGYSFHAEIDFNDFIYEGDISKKQFGQKYTIDQEEEPDCDLFDWGYVITVWKSQGSEWRNVIYIDEHCGWLDQDDRNRLLYTAITRARESLTIFKK